MLPHPFFLWVLGLNNHVGPAGFAVSKPILTFPSHLLFHVPRNVFQDDLLHYFPRSGVCTSLLDFFQDLESCFRVVTASASTDYLMSNTHLIPVLVNWGPAVYHIWLAHPVPMSPRYLYILQKSLSTACVLPCHLCWRRQGSYRCLWEQGSDPGISSLCLKKSSSGTSLWCDVVHAFHIL